MAQIDIYDISQYLKVTDTQGYADFLVSPFLKELLKLPVEDYINVSGEILDEVTFNHYGTEKLWWVIAYYNGVINPMNPGTRVLTFPHINDIESLLLKYRL